MVIQSVAAKLRKIPKVATTVLHNPRRRRVMMTNIERKLVEWAFPDLSTLLFYLGVSMIIIPIMVISWRNPFIVMMFMGFLTVLSGFLLNIYRGGLLGLFMSKERMLELGQSPAANQSIYDFLIVVSLDRAKFINQVFRVVALLTQRNLTIEEIHYLVQSDYAYINSFRALVTTPLLHYVPVGIRSLIFGEDLVTQHEFLGDTGEVGRKHKRKKKRKHDALCSGFSGPSSAESAHEAAYADFGIDERDTNHLDRNRLLPLEKNIHGGPLNARGDKISSNKTTAPSSSAASPSSSSKDPSPYHHGHGKASPDSERSDSSEDDLDRSDSSVSTNSDDKIEQDIRGFHKLLPESQRAVQMVLGLYTSSFLSSNFNNAADWNREVVQRSPRTDSPCTDYPGPDDKSKNTDDEQADDSSLGGMVRNYLNKSATAITVFGENIGLNDVLHRGLDNIGLRSIFNPAARLSEMGRAEMQRKLAIVRGNFLTRHGLHHGNRGNHLGLSAKDVSNSKDAMQNWNVTLAKLPAIRGKSPTRPLPSIPEKSYTSDGGSGSTGAPEGTEENGVPDVRNTLDDENYLRVPSLEAPPGLKGNSPAPFVKRLISPTVLKDRRDSPTSYDGSDLESSDDVSSLRSPRPAGRDSMESSDSVLSTQHTAALRTQHSPLTAQYSHDIHDVTLRHNDSPDIPEGIWQTIGGIPQEEMTKAKMIGKGLLKQRLNDVTEVKHIVAQKQRETQRRNAATSALMEADFDITTFITMRLNTFYVQHIEKHVLCALQYLCSGGILLALKGLADENAQSLTNALMPSVMRCAVNDFGKRISYSNQFFAKLSTTCFNLMLASARLVTPSKTMLSGLIGLSCGYGLYTVHARLMEKKEENEDPQYVEDLSSKL